MLTNTSTALRFDTGLVDLTRDEIDAVAGGYEPKDIYGRPDPNVDCIYYGVGYLLSRGLVGTFKDFAWQIMN